MATVDFTEDLHVPLHTLAALMMMRTHCWISLQQHLGKLDSPLLQVSRPVYRLSGQILLWNNVLSPDGIVSLNIITFFVHLSAAYLFASSFRRSQSRSAVIFDKVICQNITSSGDSHVTVCGVVLYAKRYAISCSLHIARVAWAIRRRFMIDLFWRSTSPFTWCHYGAEYLWFMPHVAQSLYNPYRCVAFRYA